jgi:hypothetical protein
VLGFVRIGLFWLLTGMPPGLAALWLGDVLLAGLELRSLRAGLTAAAVVELPGVLLAVLMLASVGRLGCLPVLMSGLGAVFALPVGLWLASAVVDGFSISGAWAYLATILLLYGTGRAVAPAVERLATWHGIGRNPIARD